jgi:hypothetical protein
MVVVQVFFGIRPQRIHVGIGIGVMYEVKFPEGFGINGQQHQPGTQIHDPAICFGSGDGFVGTIVNNHNEKRVSNHSRKQQYPIRSFIECTHQLSQNRIQTGTHQHGNHWDQPRESPQGLFQLKFMGL